MIIQKKILIHFILFASGSFLFLSNVNCKVYSFNDVSLDPDVKTVFVKYIDNKALYRNPLLSPELTQRLRQKIVNQTKLTQVSNENADKADLFIEAEISNYDVTTSGISNQQVATNRLTVGVNIKVTNNKKPSDEPKNHSVSRSFDFSANLSLQQAERSLNDEIIRNLTDEIFNRIFSDW